MKSKKYFSKNTFLVVVHMTLLLIIIALQAGQVQASNELAKYSDSSLYRMGEKYFGKGRWEFSAMYYFALQQRDSSYYKEYQGFFDNKVKVLEKKLHSAESFRNYSKVAQCAGLDSKQDDPNSSSRGNTYSLSEWPPRYHVLVCTEPEYLGKCQLLEAGYYNNASSIGLPDNSISSIMLGYGAKIQLAKGDSGSGGRVTITYDYLELPYGWNDVVSSVQVYR